MATAADEDDAWARCRVVLEVPREHATFLFRVRDGTPSCLPCVRIAVEQGRETATYHPLHDGFGDTMVSANVLQDGSTVWRSAVSRAALGAQCRGKDPQFPPLDARTETQPSASTHRLFASGSGGLRELEVRIR
jgi:hypothetical protein